MAVSNTNSNPVKRFFVSLGRKIKAYFVGLGQSIKAFFVGLGRRTCKFFVDLYLNFKNGNWKTRMSYFIMGFGCFANKQILRGILYLLAEIGFILFMVFAGAGYLQKLGTLGDVEQGPIIDPNTGIQIGTTDGDNSLLILLFGVSTILIMLVFAVLYFKQIKNAADNQFKAEMRFAIPGTRDDLKQMLNQNFHTTLLALPTIGLLVLTIIPLIFMILIAFTNYDKNHLAPNKLFTWVGFQNFVDLFKFGAGASNGSTFFSVLGWTLLWAVLATVTTYIGGMVLAILINKKGVRFKKVYRSFFVITIAVPQFVSLLVISKFFGTDGGLINQMLMSWGWIDKAIPWFENVHLARTLVIVINMWVGVPYSMLITSGILMNIPEDLYEAARIDGAGPVKTFFKITLPYMLFVTGPYLLTQFIGNINNFNVIYLLTGGGPTSPSLAAPAGKTDLLITWLYDLTVSGDYQDYKTGSVIGILVFIVCSVFSLAVYSRTGSVKNEEEFQ
ncbi:MAG: sugar ABC transporter permease [Corallococcus sp.]|nr:sugar ABC transporter permease [Corallococcus sp.]MCM1360089.1 sugar ABC transporter permease [Corallococcus sp.]MCM1395646.1 sugar ABC transporter permease [Corallococcus sp.]